MKLHTVLATAWFLAGSFLPAPFALAGEALLCDGVIDSGTLDNVIIPEGGDCTLEGDALVEGNVYADGASNVVVDGIRVDGNVRIRNIKNPTGNIDIINGDIGGNVILANNALGEILVVNENAIDGNVKLLENLAAGRIYVGSCELGGNTVGGNIMVIDNTGEGIIVNCSDVARDVTVVDNTATSLDVQVRGNPDEKNVIGGNLMMLNNRAPEEREVVVEDNRIEGNLVCGGNKPDVTLASSKVGGEELCFD